MVDGRKWQSTGRMDPKNTGKVELYAGERIGKRLRTDIDGLDESHKERTGKLEQWGIKTCGK